MSLFHRLRCLPPNAADEDVILPVRSQSGAAGCRKNGVTHLDAVASPSVVGKDLNPQGVLYRVQDFTAAARREVTRVGMNPAPTDQYAGQTDKGREFHSHCGMGMKLAANIRRDGFVPSRPMPPS